MEANTDQSAGAFTGKRVMLGVTASIAAYKAAELCSLLVQAGADVRVLMTPNATHMIGPSTFEGLTHRPAAVDIFAPDDTWEAVLERSALPADIYIIAPCTADCLARIAGGQAGDFVAAAALAATCPVLVAPAMATSMWENPRTRRNVALLEEDGVHFVGPADGRLASGRMGVGRMVQPEGILQAAEGLVAADPGLDRSLGGAPAPQIKSETSGEESPPSLEEEGVLSGKNVLITAGSTQESIDPVRLITNRSTGKMGIALAEAAAARGADVTLVLGPSPLSGPPGVNTVRVVTAQEMRDATVKIFSKADVVIAAAAVSDYRPASSFPQKVKKTEDPVVLELERTPDILAEMGSDRRSGQILIGFAAETENLLENARAKLVAKNLDAVVANDISEEGAGFAGDTNSALFVTRDGVEEWPLMSKRDMAERILDAAVSLSAS